MSQQGQAGITTPCRTCGGTGRVTQKTAQGEVKEKSCPNCKGAGRVNGLWTK